MNHLRQAVLLVLSIVTFAATSARAEKLPIKLHSDPALVGLWSLLATAVPNLKQVSGSIIRDHHREIRLADGTKISGLYFQDETGENDRPLFIANFGLFTSEYARSLSLFIEEIVTSGKLKGDVFIVDSATSSIFFSLNHDLSLGGYDEGRIIVDLAQKFKSERLAPIYLLGVSLGGNAIIQALIEDERRQSHLFSGGLALSAVLDEAQSTQTLMSAFGKPLELPAAPRFSKVGHIVLDALLRAEFGSLRKDLPADQELDSHTAGRFYYEKFSERLERLKENSKALNWDPAVSTDSVESYALSSGARLKLVKNLKVPLVVVHAKNDPLVPFAQFKIFEKEHMQSHQIQTLSTHFGGHWGFLGTYGSDWMMQLLNHVEAEAN